MSNNDSPFIDPNAVPKIMARLGVSSEESRVFITMILEHYEVGGLDLLNGTCQDAVKFYEEFKKG